jgi:hypothetical protein
MTALIMAPYRRSSSGGGSPRLGRIVPGHPPQPSPVLNALGHRPPAIELHDTALPADRGSHEVELGRICRTSHPRSTRAVRTEAPKAWTPAPVSREAASPPSPRDARCVFVRRARRPRHTSLRPARRCSELAASAAAVCHVRRPHPRWTGSPCVRSRTNAVPGVRPPCRSATARFHRSGRGYDYSGPKPSVLADLLPGTASAGASSALPDWDPRLPCLGRRFSRWSSACGPIYHPECHIQ